MHNLIPQFIEDQYRLGKLHGKFQAHTMFIDLTDFTPLTNRMMQRGKEGAEQLSDILNGIFSPLVHLVYNRGGFIPYFAGDAFTAIFPVNEHQNSNSILQTAQLMRDLVRGLPVVEAFRVGSRLGLSAGEVEWGIVGSQLKAFYFKGKGIQGCVDAQKVANDQEIVISERLKNGLDATEGIILEPAEKPGYFKLVKYPLPVSLNGSPKKAKPPVSKEIARHFLPEAVLENTPAGEFRNVVSFFLSFEGANEHEILDKFISIILNQIRQFSGYFKEIDFGDKGGVLVGFFGAPVTFEDYESRALEFAYTTRDELNKNKALSQIRFRMGLTSGLAFTGIIGGEERCQYSVVGNHVNLAARLMTKAEWGNIVTGPALGKNPSFHFTHKGDLLYKGIEKPVPTYLLTGIKDGNILSTFTGEMSGREREIEELLTFSEPVFEQHSAGIAFVFGDPGIGKSRLAYEFKNRLSKKHDAGWIDLQPDHILKKPFHPFLRYISRFFNQSSSAGAEINKENFEKTFEEKLFQYSRVQHPDMAQYRRELWRTKPILAALLGLTYENSLWEQLDARGRFENTVSAISSLLGAEALHQPKVFYFEDAHNLDENSKVLLQRMLRKADRLPALFLLAGRFNDDGSKPPIVNRQDIQQIRMLEISLTPLSGVEIREMAELLLGGELTEEFQKMLLRITNGNPFYLEQILQYFIENNLLSKENNLWTLKDTEVKVSDSIQAVLMARIDRLSGMVKETVKTAAVIGREFEVPVLSEVMSHNNFENESGNGFIELVKEQVKAAEQVKIWEAVNELRYIFQHSLLREAVYDMQLGTRLRHLHRLIAQAIEKLYDEKLNNHFIDLAFHFKQAGVLKKAIDYTEKAAVHARNNFQNQQALELYEDLLELLEEEGDDEAILKILFRQNAIYELTGQWAACEKILNRAFALAWKLKKPALLGRANNELGKLAMLRGNYERARKYFEEALAHFEESKDDTGLSKVSGNMGNLFFRKGNYESAKDYLSRSLSYNRDKGYSGSDAQLVATIGLAHMNQGNYSEGIAILERYAGLASEKNDKRGLATLLTNLGIVCFEKGDLDRALDCYEKGLALSEELGNKQLISIATGCIGSVYQEKGNYASAMHNFKRDLDLCEELGDKQGLAIAHCLVGELQVITGEFEEAKLHLLKSLELSEQLGYRKGIAKSANNMGDIHFVQRQFEEALEHYNRAIQETRSINNKLLLGESLMEKGMTLAELGRLDEAFTLLTEVLALAEELGNPDLAFKTSLFSAKVKFARGEAAVAQNILAELLDQHQEPLRQASIQYMLFKMEPGDDDRRKAALELFISLYDKTPKYLFKKRIEELAEG